MCTYEKQCFGLSRFQGQKYPMVIVGLSVGDGGRRNGWQSVIGDTDFELAPTCELVNVMKGFSQYVD